MYALKLPYLLLSVLLDLDFREAKVSLVNV
jgi:hypothetical protein